VAPGCESSGSVPGGSSARLPVYTLDTRQIHVRYTLDTRQIHVRYTLDTRQIHVRYTLDTR